MDDVKIWNDIKKSVLSLKWYEWVMAGVMIAIAAYAMISAFAGGGGSNPPWLTVINFISAICGVFCVFLCAKASIANFAFAAVNTLVYMIYLWYWKIYGTFFLEALWYLPLNFLSWWNWAKHRDNYEDYLTKAKRLTIKQDCVFGALVVLTTIVAHAILVKVNGTVPWLDAATLAIGLVAGVLELLRYREQYVLWIITDVIAVAMYIVHFDAVYLTKKSIYLIVAILGIINWVKLNRERNSANE